MSRSRASLSLLKLLGLLSVLVASSGCRGDRGTEPPVHFDLHLDQQRRNGPQSASTHFSDGRAMRPQLPHTIAFGELHDNAAFYRGRRGNSFTRKLPLRLSMGTLKYGQQRYEIYCAPCHGLTGEGHRSALVATGLTQKPTSILEERLRKMPVGQLFAALSAPNKSGNGKRIAVADRWSIVAYLRALQIAGTAPIERIPTKIKKQRGWQP